MVSGVQAKLVQQGVRERGANTRGADQDAAAVLGKPRTPQTAHRLHMVGKGGGGGYMTSIDRNGITTPWCSPSRGAASSSWSGSVLAESRPPRSKSGR